MPILKITTKNKTKEMHFSGTPLLSSLLEQTGCFLHALCGGRGICGKCAVKVWGEISYPKEAEMENGMKLACKTRLIGDATVEITDNYNETAVVETLMGEIDANSCDFKYGIALDIGTTTLALKLFSGGGDVLAESVAVNPQRSVSSDVVGRIDAAINGKLDSLRNMVIESITMLIEKACSDAKIEPTQIEKTVITGNTAMLYFLCGINPKSLAFVPFKADNLFDITIDSPIKVYLPPCINAFVGADLVCSVLASGMCESDKTALLCDLGTNGEIALWKEGKLYVTSTAAGPAFEGVGISCGCPCSNGAVDKVWWENRRINLHTVNDMPEIGLCGSGLIDAVATFLKQGYLDSSGVTSTQLNLPSKGKPLFLTNDDIRALQLAKSAIYSGIETLLESTSTSLEEIESLYLSGGFGNRLDVNSAAEIGLISKELISKTYQIGNGALHGATLILFDDENKKKAQAIANNTEHIQLGGNEYFNKRFVENISF